LGGRGKEHYNGVPRSGGSILRRGTQIKEKTPWGVKKGGGGGWNGKFQGRRGRKERRGLGQFYQKIDNPPIPIEKEKVFLSKTATLRRSSWNRIKCSRARTEKEGTSGEKTIGLGKVHDQERFCYIRVDISLGIGKRDRVGFKSGQLKDNWGRERALQLRMGCQGKKTATTE